MNPSDEIFLKTNANMIGHWMYEGDIKGYPTRINLRVSNEKLVINWWIANIYKEGIEISGNAHWFNEFLVFMEGMKYFIRSADEKKMSFGEMEPGGTIGKVVWEYEFVRLKEG